MSELYLVLKTRLDDVTKWVEIGSDVMREARQAKGLSYETVARSLHVSSKTYERWEKRGGVPNQNLEDVARTLGLQIERTDSRPVIEVDDPAAEGARLDALERQVGEVLAGIRELLGRSGDEQEPSADGEAQLRRR